MREDLLAIADLVWRSYYHLGEREDLAFQLGVLALELGAHEDALRYCDESVALYGPDAHTSYNRALALRALRRLDEALTAVEETSRLIEVAIGQTSEQQTLASAPVDVRFGIAVAGFGQLLQANSAAAKLDWDDTIALAQGARGDDPFGYRAEMINLMRLAKSLAR